MRDIEPRTNRLSGTFAKFAMLVAVAVMMLVLAGCHKAAQQGGLPGEAPEHGIVTTDPEVVTNLGNLTMELHGALHHHSQGFSNFDEFVSYAQVQPPPPPSGTKYAISKTCQIVLVQAKK